MATQQESATHSVAGALAQPSKRIAPSLPESHNRPNSRWYLGIDFGSCGLSAALLDRTSGQLHPIYWETTQHSEPQAEAWAAGASFRITQAAVMQETPPGRTAHQVTIKSVGLPQLSLLGRGEFLLQNFKLPLKVGIPYQRDAGMYEPLLQRSPLQAISIALPLQGLRALLATLNPRKQGQKVGESGEILDAAMPRANFRVVLFCKGRRKIVK